MYMLIKTHTGWQPRGPYEIIIIDTTGERLERTIYSTKGGATKECYRRNQKDKQKETT